MNPGTITRTSATVAGEVITWRELPRQEVGVSFNDPTSRREWLFDGSFLRDSILTAAGANIPILDTCAGVSRYFERYDCKEQGGGAWIVSAQYRSKPAYWDLSITMTGGTAKMLQSIKTVRGYDCTGAVIGEDPHDWKNIGAIRNFQRAIGVNGNNVEGCEITIPKSDYTVNYKFSLGSLSAAYLQTLYKMAGKANDDDFTLSWNNQSLTFARGDLLFRGATAKQTSDNQLDLSFQFSASKGLAGGTLTTSPYVQPAVNVPPFIVGNDVVVDVDSTALFRKDQEIYIVGESSDGTRLEGGEYTITDVHSGDSWLRLERVANSGSEEAGVTIPAGAMVSADVDDHFPLGIGSSSPIKKEGWQYLWVFYEERNDFATGRMLKVPTASYVEQVLKYDNFNNLGIV